MLLYTSPSYCASGISLPLGCSLDYMRVSGLWYNDNDLPATGSQSRLHESTGALAADNDLPTSGPQVQMFLVI